MGAAIGGSLIMAVGIAITPLAMATAVFLLSTHQGRTNGIAFVLGWILGLLIVGAIVFAVIDSAHPGTTRAPATWASWMRIILGLLLLAIGGYELRKRPDSRPNRVMPDWAGKAENVRPTLALGVGAVLAGARPKNLLLVIAGTAAIVAVGISKQGESIAYLVFAGVATIGVAIPVVVYLTAGDRRDELTRILGDWLARNTATIMFVVCIVIGVDLIGRGITQLAS